MSLFYEGLFMRIIGITMILTIVYLLFTEGCGTHDLRRDCVQSGQGCEGVSGRDGRDGTDGKDGRPGNDGVSGPAGPQGEPGREGTQGPKGIPGAAGPAGADGYSLVSVSETVLPGDYFCPTGGVRIRIAQDTNRNGSLDNTDTAQSISSICNGLAGNDGSDGRDGADGEDGEDGQDATSPFLPISLVDPCGDKAGVYDEVFIRMQNGTLLASFSDNSNGQNTRFSVISVGSYKTTDGSNCFFSIDANGNLYNEHY